MVTMTCPVSTSPTFLAWCLCCLLGITWTLRLDDSVPEETMAGAWAPKGKAGSAPHDPSLRLSFLTGKMRKLTEPLLGFSEFRGGALCRALGTWRCPHPSRVRVTFIIIIYVPTCPSDSWLLLARPCSLSQMPLGSTLREWC